MLSQWAILTGTSGGYDHRAFTQPVFARGRCVLPFRHARRHASTNTELDKGVIEYMHAAPPFVAWTGPAAVLSDATYDLRAESTSIVNGGDVAVGFFRGAIGPTPVDAGFVVGSWNGSDWTWGSAKMLPASFSEWDAWCCVLDIEDGQDTWWIFTGGRNTGTSVGSIILRTTTDAGDNFSDPVTILNGESANKYYAEPSAIKLANGDVLLGVRNETDGSRLYLTHSGGQWSSPRTVAGHRGHPRFYQSPTGLIFSRYRNATDSNKSYYATSTDNGETWSAGVAIGGTHLGLEVYGNFFSDGWDLYHGEFSEASDQLSANAYLHLMARLPHSTIRTALHKSNLC